MGCVGGSGAEGEEDRKEERKEEMEGEMEDEREQEGGGFFDVGGEGEWSRAEGRSDNL